MRSLLECASPSLAGVVSQRQGEEIPLLGKGGVDATVIKTSRSLLCWSGRGGWFNYRLFGGLNQPPRLRR
jgi:hypothetical protein